MRAAEPAAMVTSVGVAELHDLLRGAVRRAGLDQLWVTGVVSGLRRGPRFTSWELVDYQPDATAVRAVLHVGAFPRELGEITQVLTAAGVELADGLELSVLGRLESAPAYGRLRLLAQGVDPRVAVGGVGAAPPGAARRGSSAQVSWPPSVAWSCPPPFAAWA